MAAPNGVRSFFKMTNRWKPRTIILAGTGRGEEIPVMRKLYRRARIIGIDPLEEHWRYMRKFEQLPDVIIRGALYHTEGQKLTFHLNYEPDQRATIYDLPVPIESEITRKVQTVSLEGVIERHGPVKDALLWIDIEGGEYEALRCSTALAAQKAIQYINVELNFMPPRNMPPWAKVNDVLESFGYRMAGLHSVSRSGRQADAIFIRDEQWQAMRVATATKGKQRKLERLVSGRGKTGDTYRHPREEPREETAADSNGRHPRKAAGEAAAGKGPA